MPDDIIKVENLGKKYRIRHQQDGQRYVAMRDVIANSPRNSCDARLHELMPDKLMSFVKIC